MTRSPLDFAALVGSRICHDLISPIGAINNGMELLSMSGAAPSPEMALISESVDAANARIRFFRVAYGAASPIQQMGREEIVSILRDLTRGSRVDMRWEPLEDIKRAEAQIAFLALQCAEVAMPYGGSVAVQWQDERWCLTMTADRLNWDAALWDTLNDTGAAAEAEDIKPAHVQFSLLPLLLEPLGRRLRLDKKDSNAVLYA